MSKTKCQFLIVSFTTDWRFAPSRSQEIVDALITNHKPVSYLDIDAEQGHDSFLFPIPLYVKTLRAFLGGEEHFKIDITGGKLMRIDQQLAEKWIKPGSSVLDLGVVTVNYWLI
jgi:hypothetical protein